MTSAHKGNYTSGRTQPIRFLVLHYTAGRNDTAINNVRYFRDNITGSSAHYFVDDGGWLQSVDDRDTAWSVGTAGFYIQKHPQCRNGNSISIEMCCRYQNGQYSITPTTVNNALRLTKILMERYDIPAENVLRHWDVVNKPCPAPWVEDESFWKAFQKKLKGELDVTKEELLSTAGTGDRPSAWAKDATDWAKKNGVFLGDGEGNYGWQQPITREALAQVLQRLEQLIADR